MNKPLTVLLCLVLLVCLPACGGEAAPQAEPEPTAEAVTVAEAVTEPEADAETEPEAAPEAEATPEPDAEPALDEAAFSAAQSVVGRDVGELYALIGEPVSSQYAASCLVEGADDGMLLYDGFYVWTVRDADGETVYEVAAND